MLAHMSTPMCLMYKYLHMCGKVPTEASRGMGVPGAGLPGVCEVPDGGAGTQAQLSTLNEPQALFVTAKPSPAPERM